MDIKQMIQFLETDQGKINISDPSLLKEALIELDEMVGLKNVKESILRQMKYMILNKMHQRKSFEENMLHTIIYGGPGLGKTTIAKIIAKIYIGIGMVKRNFREQNDKESNQANNIDLLIDSTLDLSNILRDKILQLTGNTLTDSDLYINQIIYSLNLVKEKILRQTVNKEIKKDIIIAKREDLISDVVGGTCIKTRQILEKARGGVLIIDEAYSLCYSSSSKDYGREALTCIIEFMDSYPDELVVIFSGYKDKMIENLFNIQPGLERRCQWFYEIEPYSTCELVEIFQKKLSKGSWHIHPSMKIALHQFIQEHKVDLFQYFGGSIEKLLFQCKLSHAEYHFNRLLNELNPMIQLEINDEIFQMAVSRFKQNCLEVGNEQNHIYI